MRTVKTFAVMLCFPLFTFAAKPRPTVDVEVVSNDTRAVRYQAGGLVGAIAGARTEQVVFGLNAIISDKHVKLSCAENHRGCPSFETGKTFTGELDKDNIWIIQIIPITNRIVRTHFKITGGW